MGIDALSADEQQLLSSMRAGDAGRSPMPEAEPAPETPETQAEAAPSAEAPSPEPTRTVPHEQFHAERERRRAAERALADQRAEAAAEKARIEERLQLLMQATAAQPSAPASAPAATEAPNLEGDPVAYIRHLESRVNELAGTQRQAVERDLAAARVNELAGWGAAQERAFAEREPNYNSAINWLMQQRDAELRAIGIADPNARVQQLRQDALQLTAFARQQGSNPAERFYQAAVARGWTPSPPASPGVPAAAPPVPAPPSDAERAAAIQRGHAQAASIGSVGSAPRGEITAERLASMSDAEFERVYATMAKDPDALRRAFGA